MKILSFDPASHTTGYAILQTRLAGDGPTRQLHLVDCGTLTATKKHVLRRRLDAMLRELPHMLAEVDPQIILVETMDSKQFSRNQSRRSALPAVAFATGAFYGYLRGYAFEHPFVETIAVNNAWTRSFRHGRRQATKPQRQLIAASLHPRYRPEVDPGQDVSDAIMIAHFWVDQQTVDVTA